MTAIMNSLFISILLLLIVVSDGTPMNSSLTNDNYYLKQQRLIGPVSKNINLFSDYDSHRLEHLRRAIRNVSQKRKRRIAEYVKQLKFDSYVERNKRAANQWIKKSYIGDLTKSYAFIVRDEEIPPCPEAAPRVTESRYFMCTGVIIGPKHVLTAASCIHYAHIYEHHIEAELAVLIGVDWETNYVLKIDKFEMHPDYAYDIDATNHAMNNLAIIYLSCAIPQQLLIVPKLPKSVNDDLGHVCCPDRCNLVTVVTDETNHHEMMLLNAKNLPTPYHDEEDKTTKQVQHSTAGQVRDSPQHNDNTINGYRRFKRKAPSPSFFVKVGDDDKTDSSAIYRGKVASQFMYLSGRRSVPAVTQAPPVSDIDEKLRKVNWFKVHEVADTTDLTSKKKDAVENFAKQIVDLTLKKVEMALQETDNEQPLPFNDEHSQGTGPIFNDNKDINQLTNTLTGTILKATLSELQLSKNNIEIPSEVQNLHCPPLGTPIINKGILLGLVAYTCDDIQPWVPWQYVNIRQNMDWIRERVKDKTSKESENNTLNNTLNNSVMKY